MREMIKTARTIPKNKSTVANVECIRSLRNQYTINAEMPIVDFCGMTSLALQTSHSKGVPSFHCVFLNGIDFPH